MHMYIHTIDRGSGYVTIMENMTVPGIEIPMQENIQLTATVPEKFYLHTKGEDFVGAKFVFEYWYEKVVLEEDPIVEPEPDPEPDAE